MFLEIANSQTGSLAAFHPYPAASSRQDYEMLPDTLKKQLVAIGESHLNYICPTITATDFMRFSRSGNRVQYESKLFERRIVLNALVLAECIDYQGRFLDDIVNIIFAICEESAWQLPAHNSYVRDTPALILPDVTKPVVDLFAAETGAVLSVAEYLLHDALQMVSPTISTMITDNINRRIITPYLDSHFWWMGDGVMPLNNWTVWCTQNVLLTAFTSTFSSDLRHAVFMKACQSLDYFLEGYGEDGCCDEGAQYFRHAGLCLFNNVEILNEISNQAFKGLYQEQKIKNIASYILNVHVDGKYYVNFADCSPVAGRCNAREYLFGQRTDNLDLMAFAASDYQKSEDPLLLQEHNLFYRLQMLFTHCEMMQWEKDAIIPHKDLYYDSVGLFLARDNHLCLAVKAGDNADSHNHNDTGSFTIYKNGKPFFIDVGVESYTQKTFSPDRYEIWTMQSQYHNLPSFDGILQKDGTEYCAQNISCSFDSEICQISMDIGNAYPDERITSYVRTAILEKGKHIKISDTYQGSIKPIILSLMTYEKPEICGNIIKIGNLGECKVTGAEEIVSEEIQIKDSRLKSAWEHNIYRCLVWVSDSSIELEIK